MITAPAGAHVLTDQGVPIGWSVIADHPQFAYLADPDAGRPATQAEMEATEAAAYLEYAAALAANAAIGTAPRGPWPAAKAAVTAPEPAAETRPDLAAAPAEPQPEATEDAPSPAPSVAQMAAEAHGLGPLDPAKEAAAVRFTAEHDAQDQREATAQIDAVGDATEVTPAVTEAQS